VREPRRVRPARVGGGTFTGTLSNIHFATQQGALTLVGNLTGTLTDSLGNVIGTVTDQQITLPVGAATATGGCSILDLCTRTP